MAQIIANSSNSMLLCMSYDPTGLATVRIEGWPLIGWAVDEAAPASPLPLTVGNPLAHAPPDTGAVKSPGWAVATTWAVNQPGVWIVYVPDAWRGWATTKGPHDFFMWLATNNGASRKVSAWLVQPDLYDAWNNWTRDHPDFVAA